MSSRRICMRREGGGRGDGGVGRRNDAEFPVQVRFGCRLPTRVPKDQRRAPPSRTSRAAAPTSPVDRESSSLRGAGRPGGRSKRHCQGGEWREESTKVEGKGGGSRLSRNTQDGAVGLNAERVRAWRCRALQCVAFRGRRDSSRYVVRRRTVGSRGWKPQQRGLQPGLQIVRVVRAR